jgi:cob(I)alamin adenosyltransferase
LILVYTGNGKGKTTAAFGLALRVIGGGGRAVVIQFLKGRKGVGEFRAQRMLPGLKVAQFGRAGFVDPRKPRPADFARARRGLEAAKKALSSKRPPELLVLDEANVALAFGLLGEGEVLALLDSAPEGTDVVLTGRGAPKSVIRRAELVTEMREAKHPFGGGVLARKGREF